MASRNRPITLSRKPLSKRENHLLNSYKILNMITEMLSLVAKLPSLTFKQKFPSLRSYRFSGVQYKKTRNVYDFEVKMTIAEPVIFVSLQLQRPGLIFWKPTDTWKASLVKDVSYDGEPDFYAKKLPTAIDGDFTLNFRAEIPENTNPTYLRLKVVVNRSQCVFQLEQLTMS